MAEAANTSPYFLPYTEVANTCPYFLPYCRGSEHLSLRPDGKDYNRGYDYDQI